MIRPPIKAVERLQGWCEQHFCDKCPFAYLQKNENGWLFNYQCLLNELPPWQWSQINFNELEYVTDMNIGNKEKVTES